MAKQYRITGMTRFFNGLMGSLIRLGMMPASMYLLTVRGRKSGRLYSTPVEPIEYGGERCLVSPYGAMNWVRNARAAGEVMLTKGGKSETLSIVELDAEHSAPVLKAYLEQQRMVRPYFDVTPESPIEAFMAEANKHPVFRLVPKPA